MVLALPQLLSASHALKQQLSSRRTDDKVWRRCLKMYRNIFFGVREAYVDRNMPLIDWVRLVQRMPIEKGSEKSHAAASTLAAANIVALMDNIHQCGDDEERVLALLQRLDISFPVSFLPPYARIESEWLKDQEPVQHAISIRTLLYILTAKHRHTASGSPVSLLAHIFCDVPPRVKNIELILEQGPFKLLGEYDPNTDEQLRAEYYDRIQSLRRLITDRWIDLNTVRLEEDYPLDYLTDELLPWCLDLFDLMKDYIDTRMSNVADDGSEPRQPLVDLGRHSSRESPAAESQPIERAQTERSVIPPAHHNREQPI
jgi:hypothetical protein